MIKVVADGKLFVPRYHSYFFCVFTVKFYLQIVTVRKETVFVSTKRLQHSMNIFKGCASSRGSPRAPCMANSAKIHLVTFTH